MRIQLLGPLRAIDDSGQEVALGGPKQRTVLALLCTEPGSPISTDALIEAVWGENVPDRASRSLSTYVSNLRHTLGDVIEFANGGYTLHWDRSQIDSTAFIDAVQQVGTSDDVGGSDKLRAALALWNGSPFAGLDGHGAFRDEIHRLESARLTAERSGLESDITSGEVTSAVPRLDMLLREFPLDEELRGLHMRALYLSGRQADALASYNDLKERLAEELGLDPSSQLQALELRILQHDESLELTARGQPRISQTSALPNRYSRYVGREHEVAEARRRLNEHRLVSLVGAGGIGKSSIALEAARDLQTRELTVVHVAVESIGSGDISLATARSIGLEPAPRVDPIDVISGFVATRPHLLVLDGCEARITEVAQLVDRLLSTTECTILATSREPLGLNGESTIRIDSLPIDAAIEVFKDRADLPADLDDEILKTVRSVCTALDGMPLAIELAASRAKTIPLDRLAARMSDQIPLLTRARSFDERHGSLLAALDWSYDLLEESERSLLLAVSVFLTPFTLADATAMVDQHGVEDDLSRLVEISLLLPPNDSAEYGFLEPVRQYARHKLTESGLSESARQRHAMWIVAEAHRAGKDGYSLKVTEVRSWIFDKRDEMLAAIGWALAADEPDLVISVVADIGRLLTASGAHGPFVAPALAAIEHPAATPGHNLAVASAHVAFMIALGDRTDEALDILDKALTIAEDADDLIAQGEIKQRQSVLQSALGNVELIDEAYELLVAGGDPNAGGLLYNRAVLLMRNGRFDEASDTIERHRQWCETTFGKPKFGYFGIMSELAGYRGDWEAALELAEQAAVLAGIDSMYRHAMGQWDLAGLCAVRSQSVDELINAASQHERLSERTGSEPSVFLAIEVALEREDYEDILQFASYWLTVTGSDTDPSGWFMLSDYGLTTYGSRWNHPAVFAILRPVTAALLSTGHSDEACRIAHSVPSMMEESLFEYWTESRELDLWASIFDACGPPDLAETEPLALTEIVDYLRPLLATHPASMRPSNRRS